MGPNSQSAGERLEPMDTAPSLHAATANGSPESEGGSDGGGGGGAGGSNAGVAS